MEFPQPKLKINTLSERQDAALMIQEGVSVADAMRSLSKRIVVLTALEIMKKLDANTTPQELIRMLGNLEIQ